MAAPSYATDLVDINAAAEGIGSMSALGGGGAGLSADPDFAIQGTNSATKQVSNALKGMVWEYGSTRAQATNDHIYQWIYATTPGLLDTLALGGMRISVGTSDTALNEYYIRGAAEYAEGGWVCEPVRYDSTVTPSPGRQLGSPGTDPSSFGGQIDTTATVKAVNFSVDICYEGSQIEVTAGDSGTPASYETLTTYGYDSTRRWPIALPTSSGADIQGKIYWGTGSTAAYVRDDGKAFNFVDTPHSLTDLTEIIHSHASSDQEFLNCTFQALGTNNRGIFTVLNDAVVNYSGSVFSGIDTFTAMALTVLDDTSFLGTNEVTIPGGSALGASFLLPTVAADSYAVLWDSAADPDGELDNSTFSKGAASHHAIEFIATTPTSITLRGIDFTGFSGAGTAAALNFLRATGTTTVNLVGCTGTITAQVTGSHTVSFVIDPVTATINVKDSVTKADLSGVYVYLEAKDGTGPLPYQDAITVVRSSTTATVTHTAHNLLTGHKILVEGTGAAHYFGIKTVTWISANSYSYTTDATDVDPTSVTGTGVLIAETTTGGGIANDTRSLSGDQPVVGWARLHTTSPYYKQSPIDTIVDATNGKTVDVLLISDE